MLSHVELTLSKQPKMLQVFFREASLSSYIPTVSSSNSWAFAAFRDFVGVCWVLLSFAEFRDLLRFAELLLSSEILLRFAELLLCSEILLRFAEVCWVFAEFRDLLRFAELLLSSEILLRFVEVCLVFAEFKDFVDVWGGLLSYCCDFAELLLSCS